MFSFRKNMVTKAPIFMLLFRRKGREIPKFCLIQIFHVPWNILIREIDTLVHCDICFIITIEIAADKSLYTIYNNISYKYMDLI